MSQFTDDEKRREALREVFYRKRVYAKMLLKGTIDQAEADWRIGIMAEIAEDYAAKMQPSLFG